MSIFGKYFDFYNQHFDVHGTALDANGGVSGYGETAGEYYEIMYNAIRGAQGYDFGTKTRPCLSR